MSSEESDCFFRNNTRQFFEWFEGIDIKDAYTNLGDNFNDQFNMVVGYF